MMRATVSTKGDSRGNLNGLAILFSEKRSGDAARELNTTPEPLPGIQGESGDQRGVVNY